MAATCFVQPLDLVKNRMQLMGMFLLLFNTKTLFYFNFLFTGAGGAAKEHKTSFHVLRAVIKNEGIFALYNGLSAGLLRQASYTTVRMGVYTSLFDKVTREYYDGKPPGFFAKAGIGMTAGAVGAFFGTPAEVSLIRMTSDGRLPPAERRNYSSVFNALMRITREEGVLTLWVGFFLMILSN